MATKSILKTIHLDSNKAAKKFIDALEQSRSMPTKEVELTRKCTEITGDKIKEFFGF